MQDIIKNINKVQKEILISFHVVLQMIRSWSWGEVKSQRLLITVHLSLKEMVYSAQEFWSNKRL